MKLLWQRYKPMREEGFFGRELKAVRGLGADEEDSPMTEANLIRVFKVSGLRSELRSSSDLPPGWASNNVGLLFDILEYLHDELVSDAKRDEMRRRLNPDLALYTPPMEMLTDGQIVEKAPDELQPLLNEPAPEHVTVVLRKPFDSAVEQYRRRGATLHDKQSALKHLADVLEPMKGVIKEYVLKEDESALFNIANNFYIRHLNREQRRSYDSEVWLDWTFYVYVATAKAMMAVMDREELRDRTMGEPPDDNGGLPI